MRGKLALLSTRGFRQGSPEVPLNTQLRTNRLAPLAAPHHEATIIVHKALVCGSLQEGHRPRLTAQEDVEPFSDCAVFQMLALPPLLLLPPAEEDTGVLEPPELLLPTEEPVPPGLLEDDGAGPGRHRPYG